MNSQLWSSTDRGPNQCHAERNWSEKEGAASVRTRIEVTSHTEAPCGQAKEDAEDLLRKKGDLEKEKKVMEESAKEKDAMLQKKLRTVGNYVHDSVPISNNEVTRITSFCGPL